jgi:hypothetical protein
LRIAIAQDSARLTINFASGATTVYRLDGSENRNGHVTSHARWDGPKLVVTEVSETGLGALAVTVTYGLDVSGSLVVVTTSPPRDGNEPIIRTLRYRNAGLDRSRV